MQDKAPAAARAVARARAAAPCYVRVKPANLELRLGNLKTRKINYLRRMVGFSYYLDLFVSGRHLML